MASRKKATPAKKSVSKKKAPAKKKSAKKAAGAKSSKSSKAKAAKPAKPAKKKAAAKASKASKKAKAAKGAKSSKAAKKTAAKKSTGAKSAKRSSTTKAAAGAPRPERGARGAKAARTRRDDKASVITERVAPRRTRDTTLPPDHEILDQGPLKGDPVQKELVIEAVRAALQAVEQHPIKGAPVLERRNLVDLPKEGDIDYAIAQEAQKAARELLDADAQAAAERREVDERIAQVYASEAKTAVENEDEE